MPAHPRGRSRHPGSLACSGLPESWPAAVYRQLSRSSPRRVLCSCAAPGRNVPGRNGLMFPRDLANFRTSRKLSVLSYQLNQVYDTDKRYQFVTAAVAETSLPGPLSRGREGGKTGFAGQSSIDTFLLAGYPHPGTVDSPVHRPTTVPPSFWYGVRGQVSVSAST